MHNPQPITDEMLDRLVDGELAPGDERGLLSALDAAPSEWRRCALAFVEARIWRRELAAISIGSGAAGSGHETINDPATDLTNIRKQEMARPETSRRTSRRYPAMALAASVLFAFTAGWLAPHAWRGSDLPPGQTGPTVAGVTGDGSNPTQLVQQASATEHPPWPEAIDPDHVMMIVETRPDGSERPVLVPLLDERDASRLAGGIAETGISPVLPQSVRRQLEQSGYRIHQQRRYAPLSLESGERLIVPVEDTQIVPVRAGVY